MNSAEATQNENGKGSKVILQVENDQDDVFFMKRALQKADLIHQIVSVSDGDQAISYLTGKPPYDNRSKYPIPAVVLLDLNMPRVSGLGFLAWLRGHEQFKSLPVAILSSSPAEVDMHTAEKLGALHYYVKPVNSTDLINILQDVDKRWLQS
jgi:CheY-like chemotaxis protein